MGGFISGLFGGGGGSSAAQQATIIQQQRELEEQKRLRAEEEAKAQRLEAHQKEATLRRNATKKNILAEDGEDKAAVRRKALLGG